MQGNPYYVQQGAGYGPGLAGLSSTINEMGVRRRKEEAMQAEKARLDSVNQGALEAFQTKDPEKMMEYSLLHPEVAASVKDAMNFSGTISESNFKSMILDAQLDPSPENVIKLLEARSELLKTQGVSSEKSIDTAALLEMYKDNPAKAKETTDMIFASMYPKEAKAYRDAIGVEATKVHTDTAKLNRDLKNGNITQDQYDAGIKKLNAKDDKETWGQAKEGIDDQGNPVMYVTDKKGNVKFLKGVNPEVDKKVAASTDLGKINSDFSAGHTTPEQYTLQMKEKLNPKAANKFELTVAALSGDKDAKKIIDGLADMEVALIEKKSGATSIGKIKGLEKSMDLQGTADAVGEGREVLSKVKNTFGVPVQELVRKLVMKKYGSDFNFNQPDALFKSLKSSLTQQKKRRGSMGSYIKNLDHQIARVKEIREGVTDRLGIRALDVPWRKLKTKFIGDADEQILEMYMKEISAEIQKLSQSATESIAIPPDEARKEWERIHDPALSIRQLNKIIDESKVLANIRLASQDKELASTFKQLEDVRTISSGDDKTNKIKFLGFE